MKLLFDFFPLLIFFGFFKIFDIYWATGAAIVATFVQVGTFWARNRRFETIHIITLVIITVFGGLTIALQDPVFIKWKPTIVNWILAAVLLGMLYFSRKSALEYVMGSQITLPQPIWRNLNWAWIIFLAAMGVLNLYVAFYHNPDADPQTRTETWVNFKVFWLFGLSLVFAFGQMFFLSKHVELNEEN